MIIFGHTPREWKRRLLIYKWHIASYVAVFILGAVIF